VLGKVDHESSSRGRYYVPYNGKLLPIKAVVAEAAGVPPMAFQSAQAYQILTGLGFSIVDKKTVA
jgi:hypothetical protein